MTRKHDRTRRPVATPPAPAPADPPAPLPLLVAAIVAAVCTLISVSYRLYEGDVWHHLLVGKVIWQTHAVPTTQQWSWPTFGAPEANSAWLFRALLWPFWSIGGVTGLFVWRWLTTLVVFGTAWMVSRRSGAVSFLPIFGVALAALVYAQRSDVRPESLVAVLIVVTIGLLERRTESDGPRGVRQSRIPVRRGVGYTASFWVRTAGAARCRWSSSPGCGRTSTSPGRSCSS